MVKHKAVNGLIQPKQPKQLDTKKGKKSWAPSKISHHKKKIVMNQKFFFFFFWVAPQLKFWQKVRNYQLGNIRYRFIYSYHPPHKQVGKNDGWHLDSQCCSF